MNCVSRSVSQIRPISSSPFMPGIRISVITRSGDSSKIMSYASIPLEQRPASSIPYWLQSMIVDMVSRMMRSSSAMISFSIVSVLLDLKWNMDIGGGTVVFIVKFQTVCVAKQQADALVNVHETDAEAVRLFFPAF